jgi:hypothetical protein
MTERTPYSNQSRKRQRVAESNARYEAKRNRHRVEPLFRYIARLTMPESAWIKHQARAARAKRRRFNAHAILATTLAATATNGGFHD